jgi:hypothetical protein
MWYTRLSSDPRDGGPTALQALTVSARYCNIDRAWGHEVEEYFDSLGALKTKRLVKLADKWEIEIPPTAWVHGRYESVRYICATRAAKTAAEHSGCAARGREVVGPVSDANHRGADWSCRGTHRIADISPEDAVNRSVMTKNEPELKNFWNLKAGLTYLWLSIRPGDHTERIIARKTLVEYWGWPLVTVSVLEAFWHGVSISSSVGRQEPTDDGAPSLAVHQAPEPAHKLGFGEAAWDSRSVGVDASA